MIDEKQLEPFIRQVEEKGYTGNFWAPGVDNKPLAHVLLNYLSGRIKEKESPSSLAYPFWISTLIKGELSSQKRTVCLMKVNIDDNGLHIGQVKLANWNRLSGQPSGEMEMDVKSMAALPTREQAIKAAQGIKNQQGKKRSTRL